MHPLERGGTVQNDLSHMYTLKNIPSSVLNNPPDEAHALKGKGISTVTNTSDTLIYLWMKNNTSFWYYVTYSCDTYLEGYYWLENKWAYTMIPISNVKAYY